MASNICWLGDLDRVRATWPLSTGMSGGLAERVSCKTLAEAMIWNHNAS